MTSFWSPGMVPPSGLQFAPKWINRRELRQEGKPPTKTLPVSHSHCLSSTIDLIARDNEVIVLEIRTGKVKKKTIIHKRRFFRYGKLTLIPKILRPGHI